MRGMIIILDHFWEQVAGGEEYKHTQWAMSTAITPKTWANNKASGTGLWGSGEVEWSIDFGSGWDKLDMDCTCQSMKVAGKSGQTAPCNHLIRALIRMEAKVSKRSFEDVHKDRLNQVIPF